MLDYAANAVVHWPVEQLITAFQATAQADGHDADALLAGFLGPNADVDGFWQTVKTNLQAGKVRLVFVSDDVPLELRRIVEFLNDQMTQAEVLAIEVKQYRSDAGTVLVPRLIGKTASAERVKSSGRAGRDWDRESILEDVRERSGDDQALIVEDLMDWAETHFSRDAFGHGASDGSWGPVLDLNGRSFWPMYVWTYGKVEIQFQYMKSMPMPPFDDRSKREMLRTKLNEIPGVEISQDKVDVRPNFALSVLTDDAASKRFKQVLLWALGQFSEEAAARS
ncbi:MAG TPA: hypothetical protein VGZ22_01680 [Isosphaeraceae bacterium]|jgi:hypothetical protein|nr:hypothetical protein [Isosphaeraceae bacterium]